MSTLRERVFEADHGICVGCLEPQRRKAGTWAWQVHHVIKEQNLRTRGAPTNWEALAVLLCRRCHEAQTCRIETVPLERLPQRCLDAASALGPWAEDNLRRHHPPGGLAPTRERSARV